MYAIHGLGTANVVAQQVRSATACPLPLSGTCKGCLPGILHDTPWRADKLFKSTLLSLGLDNISSRVQHQFCVTVCFAGVTTSKGRHAVSVSY
jgi:hypothetical protein